MESILGQRRPVPRKAAHNVRPGVGYPQIGGSIDAESRREAGCAQSASILDVEVAPCLVVIPKEAEVGQHRPH